MLEYLWINYFKIVFKEKNVCLKNMLCSIIKNVFISRYTLYIFVEVKKKRITFEYNYQHNLSPAHLPHPSRLKHANTVGARFDFNIAASTPSGGDFYIRRQPPPPLTDEHNKDLSIVRQRALFACTMLRRLPRSIRVSRK